MMEVLSSRMVHSQAFALPHVGSVVLADDESATMRSMLVNRTLR